MVNTEYYYSLREVERNGVSTSVDPAINFYTEKVNEVSLALDKKAAIPGELKNSSSVKTRRAAAFYSTMIQPMLATGRDAFKPSSTDIVGLCNSLCSGEKTRFVTYYALSKSCSPRRTGSPDVVIDLAELEMLKVHSLLAGVAKNLDFNFESIIVDESSEIPNDDILRFNDHDRSTNSFVVNRYLEDVGQADTVIIRPLSDSVRTPLAGEFAKKYAEKRAANAKRLFDDINHGNLTPSTLRMKIFIECIPDESLASMGVTSSEISQLRNNLPSVSLRSINRDLLMYVAEMTLHFSAIMDLRSEAGARVSDFDYFPEYTSGGRLYGGVTRSTSRWSFLPNPTRFKGKTMNPMHGLAIYDSNGTFCGVDHYSEISELSNAQVLHIGDKPVAVKLYDR